MREQPAIFIQCDCHCCGVQISQFDDTDEPICIDFWVNKWYAIPTSLLRLLWLRIRLAVRVLLNGDYFLQELILKREDFEKLRDYFNAVDLDS